MIKLTDILKEVQDDRLEKAKEAVRSARSVKYWMQPEFRAEKYGFPQDGRPNTLKKIQFEDPKKGAVGFASYDSDGKINGILNFNTEGLFKIVVRDDSLRMGIGHKLLTFANNNGIDVIAIAGKNHYSSSGRSLMFKWLDSQSNSISEAVGNKYKFIGSCDRVRSKSQENEDKWHVMMKQRQSIDNDEFIQSVDTDALLDDPDEENINDWIQDQEMQDPAAGPYKSKWGNANCIFYQVAGFEFIFVE